MTRPMYDYNKVQKNTEEQSKEEVVVEEQLQEETPSIEVFDPEPIEGTIYKCELINVRSKPSIDGEIVTRLRKGDKVHVEDEIGEWLAITTCMGMEGYCLKDYVEV